MKIIFCSDPLTRNQPDSAYESEAQAATNHGCDYELINFEKLVDDSDPEGAVRRIRHTESETLAIYRGWMLRPADYQALYEALADKNIRLINSPQNYVHCHYLPESYDIIKEFTPATVYLTSDDVDMDRIMTLLAPFGDRPLILKDYVKSRKHEWLDACYIPSASDRQQVERVVKRFLELQGDGLNVGLVFREFVPLQSIGTHPKSGMPLTKEYRLFFLDGELLYAMNYWAEGDYQGEAPPEIFGDVARRVESRFFTMDVAQRTDGTWIIVELGDGQVAGLPDNADVTDFYRVLKAKVSS